jgi:hypothetical protein
MTAPLVTNRPKVSAHVLRAIEHTVGNLPAERGGALGMTVSTGVIDQYHFDAAASSSSATYTPDLSALKEVNDAWHPIVKLAGFVHTHPRFYPLEPSGGDLEYAQRILRANPGMPYLEMPLARSKIDGKGFHLAWHRARLGAGHDLVMEKTEPLVVDSPAAGAEPRDVQAEADAAPTIQQLALPDDFLLKDGTFDRAAGASDLLRMAMSRIFIFGCGGATGFVEDLCRSGVRDFVLVDPDKVEARNLATQHHWRKDIGKYKVEALAERLLDINPSAKIVCIAKPMEDLSDHEVGQLVSEPIANFGRLPTMMTGRGSSLPMRVDVCLAPVTTLLCGMTDSFHAQARTSRLALHLGLPCLLAQVYEKGQGAEIVFAHPDGPAMACPRCILEPRYRAHLQEGFVNRIGSAGTPIAATTLLNGMKSHIAMALLHHGTNHPVWGAMLDRIGSNSLIQIRLHPDLPLKAFKRLGEAKPALIRFGESLFFAQKPLRNCPDCGGTGRLRDSIGKFSDTRIL